MKDLGGFLILALLLVVGLYVYFLPAIVAGKRRHRNRGAITVLNFALGWTLLGWVAALVWANTADVEAESTQALPDVSERPAPSWVQNPSLAPGSGPGRPAAPTSDEKQCPFCAETIKAAAIVCKHCGRDLPAPTSADPSTGDASGDGGKALRLEEEAKALGIVWSPIAERYMWRREFFKDQAEAVAYAKANS